MQCVTQLLDYAYLVHVKRNMGIPAPIVSSSCAMQAMLAVV